MQIGIPKEIKNNEYRVAIIPATVRELKKYHHQVSIASKAGAGIDISDTNYAEIGIEIVDTAQEVLSA